MKVRHLLNRIPDDCITSTKTIYNYINNCSTYIRYYQFLNTDFTIQKEISTFHIKNYCEQKDSICYKYDTIDIKVFKNDVTVVYYLLYPLHIKINDQCAYVTFSFHNEITDYLASFMLTTVKENYILFLLSSRYINQILIPFVNDPYYNLVNKIFMSFNDYINAKKMLAKLM